MVEILRNINCVVAGRGYAGKIDEVVLPKLTINTEEVRAGGTDLAQEVDMGMAPLVATITTLGIDRGLLRLFGVRSNTNTEMILRGAQQAEDGTVSAVVATLRGWYKEEDFGTWKAGQRAPLKATMTCKYYQLTYDGEVEHEIDGDNMVRIVHGVDQMEEIRAALNI